MNRRTRISTLLSLGLLLTGAAAAAGQTRSPAAPGPPASEEPLPRWDAAAFMGWRGSQVEDYYFSSDQWDARFVYGGTAGYYWTANLKLEVDISATSPSHFDVYEQFPLPGVNFPPYFRSDHRVVSAALGGLVIYQFFENASFHPFLGGGAGVITTRDRVTTQRQTQTIQRTPNSPPEVIVIAEASTHTDTENNARGLIVAGFKAYPGERWFFRTDVQWTPGSPRARDVSWRLGVGVDF